MRTLQDQLRDIIQIENQEIFKRLDSLGKGQQDLHDDVKEVKTEVTEVKQDIKKVNRKLDKNIERLDNFYAPRIKRLEENANLPTLRQN